WVRRRLPRSTASLPKRRQARSSLREGYVARSLLRCPNDAFRKVRTGRRLLQLLRPIQQARPLRAVRGQRPRARRSTEFARDAPETQQAKTRCAVRRYEVVAPVGPFPFRVM